MKSDYFGALREALRRRTAAPTRPSVLTAAASGQQSARLRRPLGETVSLLRHGIPGRLHPLTMRQPLSHKAPPVPDGASFQTRTFSGPFGTSTCKLYVPRHSGSLNGLVVMLHGCTQNPDDFAIGTGMNDVAEERGLIIAYPAQSPAANPSLCWNWFDVKDRGRGSKEAATIAGLTKELTAEFKIGRERVFVAGLSAGGAMACVMAATYPELCAAVGVHSGLGHRTADDLVSALAAMRGQQQRRQPHGRAAAVRTIVFHGDADQTVHPRNGHDIVADASADLAPGRIESLRGRSAGGIDYQREIIRNAAGLPVVEHWLLHGMGHAWSGGSAEGSYTDPSGPDASREMVRFFLQPVETDSAPSACPRLPAHPAYPR